MDPTDVFDEEEVRILLVGTSEEIAQALTLIDQHLRRRMMAWARRRTWGAWMKPEDLADVWQETLLAVLKAARESRFDADQPFIPWLLQIVKARVIDRCRRRSSAEEALAAVGEALKQTLVGGYWQGLLPFERDEILNLVWEGISRLPEKQRQVLEVFVDGYPETQKMEFLRQAVSDALGQEVTLAAVKRALQEGRKKVREFLRRKGFQG